MKSSPIQQRIFIGCCVVYAGAYIARLNLAAALPALVASFRLTEAQGGLIQTLFAIVYAAGQLINGAIVDRISAKRYILAGLLLSALCNALFGLCSAYWQLLLLWALNGAAQSMLWTPVVKLLAGWFDETMRKRAAMWTAFAVTGGHFAAWAISGYMAQLFSWRYSFWLPALVLLGIAALAQWLLKDPDSRLVTAAQGDRAVSAMPLGKMFFGTGLWLVLLCCCACGFIRDGVMTWGPTVLADVTAGKALSATTLSLTIPVLNLLGVLLGHYALKRAASRTRQVAGLLMVFASVLCGALIIAQGGNIWAYTLLLGLCCALMNGVNPLLTVVLPMDYAPHGRVGLAAGVIDSAVYVGSALVSVSTGVIKDHHGLGAVFTLWALAGIIGALCAFLSAIPAHKALRQG